MEKESTTLQTQQKGFRVEFDVNAISLEDLKALYKHLQIEEFGEVEKATNHEEFFACFDDEDVDGNLCAKRLIYLAVLLANDCVKLFDTDVIRFGKDYTLERLLYNTKIEFDFDECDYDGYHEEGIGVISIVETIYFYGLLDLKEILLKYEFLKKNA